MSLISADSARDKMGTPRKRDPLDLDEIHLLCSYMAKDLINNIIFISRVKQITQERLENEISKSAQKHYTGIDNLQLGLNDNEMLAMTKIYGKDAENIEEFLPFLFDKYNIGKTGYFFKVGNLFGSTIKVRKEIIRPIDEYLGEHFAKKLEKLGYSVISTGWSGRYNVAWG